MFLVPRRDWSHQLETGPQWACLIRRETQEMQLLLEILPEAERGKNALASPFPPSRLLSLPPSAQSMQEAS